jgi:LPXTG-site transpeptidase (sortase) family protein
MQNKPPLYRRRDQAGSGNWSASQTLPNRDYSAIYTERRTVSVSEDGAQQTEVTETVSIVNETVAPQMSEMLQEFKSSSAPYRSSAYRELSTDQKVSAMTRALEKARKDLAKEHRKRTFFKRLALALTAVVLLLSTGYVGINTLLTNNQVQAASHNSAASAVDSGAPHTTSAVEGTDTTPLPAGTLAKYQVAPDLPRALYISKLNIAARVLPMGVNTDGSMQAPVNIFDSGWYTGSVEPGQIGAVVIDGHSSADHEALFGNLDKLVVGDQIQLEKGDGTKLTYQVVHTDTVDKDSVNMKSLLLPYGNALRGLNLITCAGDWINSQDTLTKRIIVYTEQIS